MCGVSSDVPCACADDANTNKIAASKKTRQVPEHVVVCAITAHPQGSDGFAGALAWLMGSKGQQASFGEQINVALPRIENQLKREAPHETLLLRSFSNPREVLGAIVCPNHRFVVQGAKNIR